MAVGATLLSVHEQHGDLCLGDLCLWALVDPSASTEIRRIRIVGTGEQYDGAGDYVGTVLMTKLPLVWHVFDEH